jgi:PAS domain S-box-containing protein
MSKRLKSLVVDQKRQRVYMPKLSLRLALIVPFMMLTVSITGLVGYLSWQNGQRSTHHLVNQLMMEVSERVNLYIDNYLKTPELINRLTERAIRLNQIDITNSQQLEHYLFQQVQEFDSLRMHFSNPQGGLVGAGNDERGLTISFTDQFTKGPLSVYSIDRQGNRTKRLVHQQMYDARQRPFYQVAVAAGKPIWSPIYVYVPASRGLGIAASYPLYDQNHRLQGVLSSDLRLATISEFLQKLQVGTHGQVFVMERSGLLVASSTAEQPFRETETTQTQRLNATESQNPLIRQTAQQLLANFGDLTQIKTAQPLHFDLEGNQQFAFVTPHRDALGLDWLVVTVVPAVDFMAEINAGTRTTLLLSSGAVMGAIALGLWLAQTIVKAIQRLGRASRALADGDWDRIVQPTSHITELQVLNTSFNRMAAQLQQSFDRVTIALQESEEKFTIVFRTCPDPIGILTLDGRYVEVNDAFVNLFGYSKDELIGHNASEIPYWLSSEQQQHYLQSLQAGERIRNQEYTFRKKSGELFTVLLSTETIELQGQPCRLGIAKDISDRKQIELELTQARDLREAIFNESTDAIFLVEPPPTLRILDCNQRAVELFEATSKAELIGLQGNSLQKQQFTPEELAEIAAELERNRLWNREIEYVTMTGKTFWGSLAAKPIQVADQAIHLVRLSDISNRKQAEAALRQSEARFQQLVAAAPGAIYTFVKRPDASFSFEYISPAIEAINELTLEQSLNTLPESLIHPDDQASYAEAVAQSARTLEAFSLEFRIVTPSGKLKWLQASSRPEQRENGEIAWYGIVLDVSDRKFAEEALRQSEARFQKVTAAAPSEIYMLVRHPDGQFSVEYISPACREIQELEPEQIVADASVSFNMVHPDDRLAMYAAADHSAQTLEPFKHEWRIITPSGKLKWVQASSRPERRDNGEIVWYGVLQDISDRKLAEEALRQQAKHEQLLRAVTQQIRQSLKLDDILAAAVTSVRQSLQVDRVLVFHLTSETTGIVLKESVVPQYAATELMLWQDECFTADFYKYYQQGNPRVVPDVTSDAWASCLANFIQAMQVKSKVVAPITQCTEEGCTVVWGLLIVHACADYRQWQPAEVELLQQIANQLAIAIQQANLYQQVQTELAERKQAEAALRRSEATKNQILKAIPDLIIWMKADGTCIDSIEGDNVINIYAKSEAIGKNLYDMLPNNLGQLRRNAVKRALRTGRVQIYEHYLDIQTSLHYEEVRVVAVGEDRVLVIIRDITDRKRTELALRESEERFRRAFRDAPIGMALIGLDDRWLKVNPALCHMFGYSEAEMLSMTVSTLVYPDDVNKLQQFVEQVSNHESRNVQTIHVELRFYCHKKRMVWGLLSLSLVRDSQHQPLYYVAQIQDITEQHAIDRMKNEFVSIVSHELRTPLTAIRGFLGLLNTGIYDNQPNKAKHMLGQALTNSDRLVRLVNDILDLERLSSGKVQLVMQICEAEELMQQAVAGVQSIADEAAVMLSVVSTSAQVWAAPDAIIQTLTNLLGNAIKFSPPQSTVTLSAQSQSDSSVLFQVRDHGRGIPDDKLETIFGRFQQVDVSDSRQKGGTGLGLAICQSIVQQHGGTIWAESTLGAGSTFYFTLPIPPGDPS